jgi:hypothetical protein
VYDELMDLLISWLISYDIWVGLVVWVNEID